MRVDLEPDPLALDLDRAEVVPAVGVVLGTERIVPGDLEQAEQREKRAARRDAPVKRSRPHRPSGRVALGGEEQIARRKRSFCAAMSAASRAGSWSKAGASGVTGSLLVVGTTRRRGRPSLCGEAGPVSGSMPVAAPQPDAGSASSRRGRAACSTRRGIATTCGEGVSSVR